MDQEFIRRYFKGEFSDEELDQILDWFQTQKGRAYLREQIRNDLRRLSREPVLFIYPEVDTEKIFKRIQKNKKSRQEDTSPQSQNGSQTVE